jgi:hypothetical protein
MRFRHGTPAVGPCYRRARVPRHLRPGFRPQNPDPSGSRPDGSAHSQGHRRPARAAVARPAHGDLDAHGATLHVRPPRSERPPSGPHRRGRATASSVKGVGVATMRDPVRGAARWACAYAAARRRRNEPCEFHSEDSARAVTSRGPPAGATCASPPAAARLPVPELRALSKADFDDLNLLLRCSKQSNQGASGNGRRERGAAGEPPSDFQLSR